MVEAEVPVLVETYEYKVRELQEQKAALREKIKNCGRPLYTFDESFRTAFDFLGNPHKLWSSDRIEDKRMVLRLAFSDKLPYDQNEGFRTAQTSLPFRLLGDFKVGNYEMVDESGFEPDVVRPYGRAPRGQNVYGWRPGNSRPRTCLLAAQMEGKLQATQLWEGTCATLTFNHWLEHALCPLLHVHHVVVMDNAAFHHSTTTKELIEQTGATLLFLPPYSPDLNPFEQDFATLKKIREFHEHTTIDSIIKTYN